MDRPTKKHRSWNMSRIRSRDTVPERVVRSVLHRLGYRFRLHKSDLPGRPDIVLPRYRIVILVHGCFWHRHPGCRFAYAPKSRIPFWTAKFTANQSRDLIVRRELRKLGWMVVVIWECQTRNEEVLQRRLSAVVRKRAATLPQAIAHRRPS